MASSPLFGPQVAGRGNLRPQDITRLALAQQLLKSGTDTSPVESPWQGVARLGQALAGGYMNYRLGQEQKEREGSTAATMAQALRATKGSWNDPDTGQAMPIPNAQGGLEGAMGVLSGNPETAGLAAQLGFTQLEKKQALDNDLLKSGRRINPATGAYENIPGYTGVIQGEKNAEAMGGLPAELLKFWGQPHVLPPGGQQQASPQAAAIFNQIALGQQPGQQGAGGVQPGIIAQNTTPPPSTRVEVHAGQSLGDSAGKDVIEQLKTSAGQARTALQSLDTINTLKGILGSEPGIVSGSGANLELGLRKVLDKAGFSSDPKIPATETFRSTIGGMVLNNLKQTGANPTDADRNYVERVVGGDITLDSRSINKLMEINERVQRRVIDNHNKMLDHSLSGPGPLQNPVLQHMLKGYRVDIPGASPVATPQPQQGGGQLQPPPGFRIIQ